MVEPIISCQHVWKLYGAEPEAFLKRHNGNPSTEALSGPERLTPRFSSII